MTGVAGAGRLERKIAEYLAGWEAAHVEMSIYGFDDPKAIAEAMDAFCRRHMGVPVDDALFYQSSVGAVAGLRLADGHQVVLKAYQPDRLEPRRSPSGADSRRGSLVRG